MAQGNWREEFGESYRVPSAIEERFVDISWGNDAAPSFVMDNDTADILRLWVEHPDPLERETAARFRFVISLNDSQSHWIATLLETDSVKEAVNFMLGCYALPARLRNWEYGKNI